MFVAVLILAVLLAAPPPAAAQDVVVDSRNSCPSCSIQVSRVGTLGGPSSRDRITGPPWIATRLLHAESAVVFPPGSAIVNHLWVVILVAAPDHHLAFGPEPQQIEGRPLYPVVTRHALYNSIIEVIDIRRGVVVARHRMPEVLLRWSGGDEFVTYRQDDSGVPIVTIWQAKLLMRERRD